MPPIGFLWNSMVGVYRLIQRNSLCSVLESAAQDIPMFGLLVSVFSFLSCAKRYIYIYIESVSPQVAGCSAIRCVKLFADNFVNMLRELKFDSVPIPFVHLVAYLSIWNPKIASLPLYAVPFQDSYADLSYLFPKNIH